MSFRNVFMMLFFCAVCSILVVGCAKKPKIDLSGIRTNTVQTDVNNNMDDDWLGSDADFANGGVNDGAKAGAWGDLSSPVSGIVSDFLVDAQRWDDVVYFGFDRSELAASERPKVEALAEYLQSNPTFGAVIEGHCDERGSDEYNRALSERRALAVLEYLKSLGIAENRLQTVSYGEDRPVVQNAKTEEEHGKNRRAEFLFGTLK